MFMNTAFTIFVAFLCANLSLVNARSISQRDVFDPPITYPTTGTVWHIGDAHNVTWDTSILPPAFTGTGMIVLGFLDDSGDSNEHLDLDHPLAKGFPLISGRVEVTVPSVTTRNSYILVLFGDSGNASPKFTITDITIGNPPSSSTTSASSTGVTGTSTDTVTLTSNSTSAPGTVSTPAASSLLSTATASTPAVATVSTAGGTPSTVSLPLSSASATSPASGTTAAATASASTSNAGSRAVSLSGAAMWLPVIISIRFLL